MRNVALLSCLAPCFALAQYTGLYPDGVDVSRGPMPTERSLPGWLQADPPSTPPPVGPVHCVAEYEPMDGIIMAWEGTSAQNSILTAMAKEVTSADGDAKAYIVCDTTSERDTVANTLTAAGVNMGRVQFLVTTTDTIWCRDYGPRYVLQGGCRAIVKHTYNRNRPNDNVLSFAFGQLKGHKVYQIPLVHGGGNYHLDAVGRSWATRLIANENPTKTEPQIVQLWQDYQNVTTTLTDPFPTSVDSTQHIDMWVQVVADDKVMVSDWPQEPGSLQDNICDATAAAMQVMGYQVFRLPAFRSGGTHYTYTNVVMCNGVVIVPSFSVGSYNAQALTAWQSALPNKRIAQINCQALVTSAGVVHCVVMHVPRYTNGSMPSAYCASPNGGETLTPGQVTKIKWATDDDVSATSVDLLLAQDGTNFSTVVATGVTVDSDFDWAVPDIWAPGARLRVVARDGEGNTSQDDSDASFKINGTELPALADWTVNRGTVLTGGLNDLRVLDQTYTSIERHNPALPDPFGGPQIRFTVGVSTTVPNPASLDVSVGSKSVTGTTASIEMKNWATGGWDTITTYNVSAADVLKTVSGVSALNHVRADGRIEVRVNNWQAAPYFTVYKSYFDFVQVKARG